MDRQSAINLISDTFNNPFDEGRFSNFARNLFNDIDESKAFPYLRGSYIKNSFKGRIKKYRRLGTYTDSTGDKLDVLIVHLERDAALERARTMQRNFVAWYLKNRGEKDAAMVAYHADNMEDWRFSFVRMEYKQEIAESGRVRVHEELTPARRYSFLVGKNEPNHTAQEQIVPILQEDRVNLTLGDLEKAFSVETVTKQFYLDYRGLFEKLMEELDGILRKDSKVGSEFKEKSIDTINFAKKLLGQIVFLYFLQKKGWLGVGKDAKGNFKQWGTGPKNFMRQLFEKKYLKYDNFFNKVLEPLFYEALASEHTNNYFSLFNCKIPFLNGGLFEPIGNYNWQETDILISNSVFAEIFDTFDRYNFTVREDEPLEKEVAVDPEMLGKVFENLLPENLRKGQGAYYTPREIVHYMCQESLINYLTTECDGVISRDDIDNFIRKGEFAIEHDVAKEEGTKSYKYQVPKSIRKNAQLLDKKLQAVKICDPAIGSGAFPVGMMHEIVNARNILTTYLDNKNKVDRNTYEFKRHCIQKSLYGVDVDPGAIDIAKLRLWLSLVVDEEDYHTIKPLPNLDYKIMQGNSLVEDFHGISLDMQKDKETDAGLFGRNNNLERLVSKLHQKQNALFNATHPMDKKLRKSEVENAIMNIFHHELKQQKANYFKELENIEETANRLPKAEDRKRYYTIEKTKLDKRHNFSFEAVENDLREMTHGNKVRNFFPWKLYFADVFRKKGGFDIVVANPPYVKKEHLDRNTIAQLENAFTELGSNKEKPWSDDLYVHFIFKGTELTKAFGLMTFITNDSFIGLASKVRVRKLLLNYDLIQLIRCPEKTFEAMIYTAVFVLRKDVSQTQSYDSGRFNYPSFSYSKLGTVSYQTINSLPHSRFVSYSPILKIYAKLLDAPRVKDYAKILDTGIHSGNVRDKIFFKEKTKHGLYRMLQGRQIIRYGIFWDSPSAKYKYCDINYKPKKVKGIGRKGKSSKHEEYWHFCGDIENHHQPERLLMRQSDDDLIVAYHSEKEFGRIYTDNTLFTVLRTDKAKENNISLKYTLALLNSCLFNTFYHFLSQEEGKALAQVKVSLVSELPFVIVNQNPIVEMVDKIISLTKSKSFLEHTSKQNKVAEYEKQIDLLVYKLYGLSDKEIATIVAFQELTL